MKAHTKLRLLAAAFCLGALGIGLAVAQVERSPLLGTMNADNATLYAGRKVYPNGGFGPTGILYTIPAIVATGSGTGAQTLATYSLPANALDQVGRRLHIRAAFATAANTNNKTCTLNFGSEQVSTGTMATSAERAWLELNVLKTGSSTQSVWGRGTALATNISTYYAAGAETDTAAIVITAICTDGSNSAGDAVLVDFSVRYES